MTFGGTTDRPSMQQRAVLGKYEANYCAEWGRHRPFVAIPCVASSKLMMAGKLEKAMDSKRTAPFMLVETTRHRQE